MYALGGGGETRCSTLQHTSGTTPALSLYICTNTQSHTHTHTYANGAVPSPSSSYYSESPEGVMLTLLFLVVTPNSGQAIFGGFLLDHKT